MTSLPPLADITDIEVRLPATTSIDVDRTVALLTDASAVIRSFTKRTFSVTELTEEIRPIGARLKLSNRPVRDVTELKMVMVLGEEPVPALGWWWGGGDEVYLLTGEQIINSSGAIDQLLAHHTPLMYVTYTAGDDEVPDDVTGVVCSMVIRSLTSPGAGSMISENVGPFGYRLSDAAVQGPLTMTQSERELLKRYRRRAMTIESR